MAAPIAVTLSPWATYEDRNIVEYVTLQGGVGGTTTETVTYKPKFGRLPLWAWHGNGVTVAQTGTGTPADPYVLTLTPVAALAQGVKALGAARLLFGPGSN